jgi:hypothetical protein
MSQYDSILKMYAESGLRTVENWISLGRDIASGAKPRLDTLHRGTLLPLYTRDQTLSRPRSRPKRR